MANYATKEKKRLFWQNLIIWQEFLVGFCSKMHENESNPFLSLRSVNVNPQLSSGDHFEFFMILPDLPDRNVIIKFWFLNKSLFHS